MTRLRRGALISAAIAAALVLTLGSFIRFESEKDSHWHIGIEGGVTSMAFSPDRRVLVTATSGAPDGLDTLWNVATPGPPRRLANFEGGAPTALAPDGRTVVSVSCHDQPVLWSLASPRKPTRIATLPTGDSSLLWGRAFSPDGHILAAAYTDRLYLWNVTSPGQAPPAAHPCRPARHARRTSRPCRRCQPRSSRQTPAAAPAPCTRWHSLMTDVRSPPS